MLLHIMFADFWTDFLRGLAGARPAGYQDTVSNWIYVAIGVAVICALVMMGWKAVRKSMATNVNDKIWSRSQTILLIVSGLGVVSAALSAVWYMERSFLAVISVGGLFKGIVVAWLLFILTMIVAHLVSPWRRELL